MTVTSIQGVPEPIAPALAATSAPSRASGPADFEAVIVCNGQRYTAWETVMVRREYKNWQSTFQFTAAEPASAGKGWDNLRLRPGDNCQILLGGVKVIDGQITTRLASYDATSHNLIIAGRSRTQNLELSVQIKPGNYNGYTFEQAARGVLGPTGVNLVIKNPPSIIAKPFKSLAVQIGEGVGEFIERIAKMRGLNLTDDEDGNLVASQVDANAASVAELQEGRNILRATCVIDNQNAFSNLVMMGQHPDADADAPPRDFSAHVDNPNATSSKTQVIVAEHTGDAEDMQQRANHESAHMAWPKVECQITVVGWKMDGGGLWNPTYKVSVYSPMLFPNETESLPLGIQACTYAQDSVNGTTTTLDMRLPTALTSLVNPTAGGGGSDPIGDERPNAAVVGQPDTA